MSIIKYTTKYLLRGGLALIVIIGIGMLVYNQLQKGRHMHDHAISPAQVPDTSDPPRQSLWQKITPIFKKKPKPSHSHGHHDFGPPPPPPKYPRDLKERLDKVRSDGNSYQTNPNFFQEMFEAVSNGRDMETTIEILKKYNIYTDVVLEHMDSYEAFKYALTAPTGYKGPAVKYGERVINEDPNSAEALEAGILLGGEDNLRAVLKYHPDSAMALYKLGFLLLNYEERPGEAIVYLKKAIQMGLGQKAIQMGPEQISHSPDTGDRMLGIAYQYLGDYKSAWVHFKRAQALNPHHPWARGHLEAIAKGEPAILPVQREPTSTAIGPDTAPPPIGDTPALPPEVFVDAFVVPADVPPPQPPESASPEALARQDAEHQAFLEMLREREEFAKRLADDEQFKLDYFQEVEDFIRWAESIENDTLIETNNFLAKEMERHLLGKQTTFDPDRIKRGFEFINKYGQAEGLKHLQQKDPQLAKKIEAMRNQNRPIPQIPKRNK